MAVGADDGVVNRTAVEAALTVDPFGRAHAGHFKEAFVHQQSAASRAELHRSASSRRGTRARRCADLIVPGEWNHLDDLLFLQAVERSQQIDPSTVGEFGSKNGEGEHAFPSDQFTDSDLDGCGYMIGAARLHRRSSKSGLGSDSYLSVQTAKPGPVRRSQ